MLKVIFTAHENRFIKEMCAGVYECIYSVSGLEINPDCVAGKGSSLGFVDFVLDLIETWIP